MGRVERWEPFEVFLSCLYVYAHDYSTAIIFVLEEYAVDFPEVSPKI